MRHSSANFRPQYDVFVGPAPRSRASWFASKQRFTRRKTAPKSEYVRIAGSLLSYLPARSACAVLAFLFGTVQAAPAPTTAGADASVKTSAAVAPTPAPSFAVRFNPSTFLLLARAAAVKRTVSDVLTNLVNVDGVLIVAETHMWNRPDTLAARHYFRADAAFRPYASIGINRGIYLDPSSASLAFTAAGQTRRSYGVMAEMGAAWHLTRQFEMAADVHWFESNSAGRLLRTDAGLITADPVALTLSVAWRCN